MNNKEKLVSNAKVRIGLATTNLRSVEALNDLVAVSIENGIDFIDCAWRYGNEATIGLLMQKLHPLIVKYNPNIIIQSKVWPSQFTGGINKAVKFCLQKLGKPNGIDAYMLHRPSYNVEHSINAWKQLVDCCRNRLINVIGVANFDKCLIQTLHKVSGFWPDFLQIELSVNNMRYDRIKFCHDKNINIQAYYPFGQIEKNLTCPVLIKITKKYKITIPQLLIAFLINQKIEPIINVETVEEIKSILTIRDLILSPEDMEELKTLNTYDNVSPETLDVDLNEIERSKETRQKKF